MSRVYIVCFLELREFRIFDRIFLSKFKSFPKLRFQRTPPTCTLSELHFYHHLISVHLVMVSLLLLFDCLSIFLNVIYLCIQVGFDEIDEMINIVDRNGDGRISYSEFR